MGIDGAGGLVQDKDPRIRQQGPGKGDQLLLPNGEATAPFVYLGIVPLLHVHNKVMHMYRLGGLNHLFPGGVRAAVTNVFEIIPAVDDP